MNSVGVLNKLVTAFDQPALGGVFKVQGSQRPRLDLEISSPSFSEQAVKVLDEGLLQVHDVRAGGRGWQPDMMFDEASFILRCRVPSLIWANVASRRKMQKDPRGQDLLVPIFRAGKFVYERPAIQEVEENRGSAIGKVFLLESNVY